MISGGMLEASTAACRMREVESWRAHSTQSEKASAMGLVSAPLRRVKPVPQNRPIAELEHVAGGEDQLVEALTVDPDLGPRSDAQPEGVTAAFEDGERVLRRLIACRDLDPSVGGRREDDVVPRNELGGAPPAP
jgi:hypothetical protein